MTHENIKIIEKDGWSDDGTTPVVQIVEVIEKPDGEEIHRILKIKPWKPEGAKEKEIQGGDD